MATLTTIAEKLLIAKAYYLELLNADVAALMSGNKEKNAEKIKELGRLIRALDWDVSDEVDDDDTTALYELLLKAISYYSGATLSVDTDVVIPDITIVVDGVTLEEVQELLADYALLPDRVLAGLEYSYDAPVATISAGTYKIDNVEYSANSTPFPIAPTSTGLLKYVRFYATTAGTILSVESTPSSVAEHPDIPDGTLGLYEILVNDAGVSGGATADLSGFVTTTGSANYIAKTNSGTEIGDSIMYQDGTNINIGSEAFHLIALKLISIIKQALAFRGTPDGLGYYHASVVGERDDSPFTYGSKLRFYTEAKNTANGTDESRDVAGFDSEGNLDILGTLNIQIGRIAMPNGQLGTYIGYQAGQSINTNSTYNNLGGYQTGAALTSGYNNAFWGFQNAPTATTAHSNSGTGLQVLFALTTGSFNHGDAIHALYSLTTGVANNAVGAGALQYVVTGSNNNAIGMYAGRNYLGSGSLFLGNLAGEQDFSSDDNQLYIANNALTTLIRGRFSPDAYVRVNGRLEASENVTLEKNLTVSGETSLNGQVASTGTSAGYRLADRANPATGYVWYASGGQLLLYSDAAPGNIFSIQGTTGAISANTINTSGIDTYGTDLSSSYTARTKIDKGYADATYKQAEFGLACSDETTDLASGTAKVTFRVPYAMTITSISASVNTAPVGSTLVVDINENGTSILSTKLSIDAGEKTSTTAAVPYVLSDTAIAADSEITIDIDQVGASTAGKGLKVFIIGTRN